MMPLRRVVKQSKERPGYPSALSNAEADWLLKMDGPHRNNDVRRDRTAVIQAWMIENVRDHGYERYDDLHIDQIDKVWKAREAWIEGGLEAFQLAAELRNKRLFNLRVALGFSLLATDKPRGMDIANMAELKAQLDSSPPSLYLFETGKEPRTESGILGGKVVAERVVVQNVDPTILWPPPLADRVYFMEFKQIEFDEYWRSVFVEG